MESFNRTQHWENIYQSKHFEEVSWYQPVPETSLHLIEKFHLPKTAAIIDIGGGDSFLVDHLLKEGYQNITVMDISESAIERAKKRLGDRSQQVKWIVADASHFKPTEKYDLWHDRAAFHFLTDESEICNYIETTENAINSGGGLIIGTFSEQGPKKCSGIEIRQYSQDSLTARFSENFSKINCFTIDHKTPFDTIQNFVFCSFKKR